MTTVIDMSDPTNRTVVHLLQCRAALSIEVKTGMRHSRGSVLNLVQTKYGIKSRTKKGALKEIEKMLREQYNFDVSAGRTA